MADQELFLSIYGYEPISVFFYSDRVYIGETEYPNG